MAEIFCGHSWVAGGCCRLQFEKKIENFFFQKKFFNGQRLTLQLVIIIRVRTGKL